MKHILTYYINLSCTCLLLILVFSVFSCRKFTRVDLPIDKVTAATAFATDEAATASVLGLYATMMPTLPFFSSGGTTIYMGLASDELYLSNIPYPEDQEFFTNTLSPANSTVRTNFWLKPYSLIYHANAILEGIEVSATLTPSLAEQLKSEAHFIRAFSYFYLVNLFGDVPLLTTTNHTANAQKPRSPVSEIYGLIKEDLRVAKAGLPPAYPSGDRFRPTKWAATTLLARIYLYLQNWQEAEAEASGVLDSGNFSLENQPAQTFASNSTETIWQLAPVEQGFFTTEGLYFLPFFSLPNYALSESLFFAFEPGDQRKENWIGIDSSSGFHLHYPFKYKQKYDFGTGSPEYYIVFRLAELYLLRAEARAQMAMLPQALEDLNTVRNRAAIAPLALSDQSTLLAAIEKERKTELFAEWGHRWFDLIRTGRANAVLSAEKPSWSPAAALLPIPQSEILLNPALTQNPGY